ncbi:hypothetical protein [Collinsella sp. An2]|nr:hypothetical protein [Collinsella sp. An2]
MTEFGWVVAMVAGAVGAFMASEVVRELERRHDEMALQEASERSC